MKLLTFIRLLAPNSMSRPARGGWIEIFALYYETIVHDVPSRKGRVD